MTRRQHCKCHRLQQSVHATYCCPPTHTYTHTAYVDLLIQIALLYLNKPLLKQLKGISITFKLSTWHHKCFTNILRAEHCVHPTSWGRLISSASLHLNLFTCARISIAGIRSCSCAARGQCVRLGLQCVFFSPLQSATEALTWLKMSLDYGDFHEQRKGHACVWAAFICDRRIGVI